MSNTPRGFSLIDLVAALGILGVFFAIAIPYFHGLVAQVMLRGACQEIALIFMRARGDAIFYGADVGVKWVSVAGDVVFTIYKDGNRNGVRSADILSGRDPLVAGPFSMRRRYQNVTFSFYPGFVGDDPNGDPLRNLSDPIRFGRGDICTFTPAGRASPGSIYLSDRKDRQALVRVSPISQRIQIFEWHPELYRWKRTW
jgi:hypothetical protein